MALSDQRSQEAVELRTEDFGGRRRDDLKLRSCQFRIPRDFRYGNLSEVYFSSPMAVNSYVNPNT